MKRLSLFLWLTGSALAQTFPAGPHLQILVQNGKTIIWFRGSAWPKGAQPTLARLKLSTNSYGSGWITVERITDLARLSPASRPGHWTTGIATVRAENRSCAWISENASGGCLVLNDISRAQWSGPNNLSISPSQEPVLAAIWMTPAELKQLTEACYQASEARRKSH